MSAPDVVVIGGGPAGSAAAIRLAGAGARVTLVERSPGPHDKVCGEFVGPGAAAHLARFGLPPAGPEIRTVRLACGARQAFAPLPFAAHAVSRREMDERLLELAASRGAEVRRGVAVRDLDRVSLAVTLADGERLRPRAVFLATGKHDLRGHRRVAAGRADHVGLKMRVRRTGDDAGTVDLLLFPGGYAGYLPLDATAATLCIAVSARRYREAGADWRALLAELAAAAPLWRARLAEAEPLWPQPLAVAAQPYGFVARPEAGSVYRIGDQAAVVPSFSGEGIGLAFATAALAAETFLEGAGAEVYARRVGVKFARVSALGAVSRIGETRVAQELAMRVLGLAPGLLAAIAGATRLVEVEE